MKRIIEAKQTFPLEDSQQTHQVFFFFWGGGAGRWSLMAAPSAMSHATFAHAHLAQVDSSSEDAFDDKDMDFEPAKAVKRKSAGNALSTLQPLKSRPGNAAEAPCISFKYTKYVINPKSISMTSEMREFLERCEVPMQSYELAMELSVAHSGSVMITEDCGFSLSRKGGGKTGGVPTEFAWGDIQCIKSFRGRNDEKPGERVICFQSENGCVHTFTIDGLSGDYSKFRS
jgi:hypothetical protein